MNRCKLTAIVFIMFFCVTLVSAFEFDNIKGDLIIDKDTSNYGKIEIRNSILGIPFLQLGMVAEIELLENTDYCLENCQAIGRTTLYDNGKLINSVRFDYNKVISHEIFIGTKEIEETVYENKSSSYEEYYNWEKYNNQELEPGTYYWKIEGVKEARAKDDWIGNFLGVEVTEWAHWDGADLRASHIATETSATGVRATTWKAINFNISKETIVRGVTIKAYHSTGGSPSLGTLGIWSSNAGNDHKPQAVIVENSTFDIATTFVYSPGHSASNWGNITLTPTLLSPGNYSLVLYTNDDTTWMQWRFGGTYNQDGSTGMGWISTNNASSWALQDSEMFKVKLMVWGLDEASANVELEFPEDNYVSPLNEIEFNCSVTTSGSTLINMSLFHNATGTFERNQTFDTLGTYNSSIFNTTITGGTEWNCEACTLSGACFFDSSNRTVFVDTEIPIIIINLPIALADYGISGQNETLNWTIIDDNLDSIWYNYNGTNITVYGASNETEFQLDGTDFNLTIWTNDSAGNINSTFVEWDYKIWATSETYNTTSYETARETFSINVTANTSLTAASLIYKGTSYAGTKFGTIWSKAIDIQTGTATNSFNWNFTYAGETISSNTNNQIISSTNFSLCGRDGTSVPYLNFTFKDEGDNSALNVTNDLADFDFWIGSGIDTKNYVYTNTTDHFSYAFCFIPADKTVTTDLTFKYAKTGYPQRTFVYDSQDLTNSTTNELLYLLSSSDGIYSSISAVESTGAPIQGVTITVERQFSGIWTLLTQGTTDSSGLVTFWLNPNYLHRITATKTGYTAVQVSITPSQSLYTITMGTGVTGVYNSSIQGLIWEAYPGSGPLEPQANQKFNATVWARAGVVELDNCKFELLNASNISQVLASDIDLTNSTYCFMDITYTTTTDGNLFGRLSVDTDRTDGYVIVDSDWKWILIDINATSWRTITSFFDELGDIGEFGEGNEAEFSRIIFFFLLATIGIGVFTYFTGVELSSPGASIYIIWGLIIIASVSGFLTFESGADNIAGFFEQYGFSIISTIFVIGFSLNKLRKSME